MYVEIAWIICVRRNCMNYTNTLKLHELYEYVEIAWIIRVRKKLHELCEYVEIAWSFVSNIFQKVFICDLVPKTFAFRFFSIYMCLSPDPPSSGHFEKHFWWKNIQRHFVVTKDLYSRSFLHYIILQSESDIKVLLIKNNTCFPLIY